MITKIWKSRSSKFCSSRNTKVHIRLEGIVWAINGSVNCSSVFCGFACRSLSSKAAALYALTPKIRQAPSLHRASSIYLRSDRPRKKPAHVIVLWRKRGTSNGQTPKAKCETVPFSASILTTRPLRSLRQEFENCRRKLFAAMKYFIFVNVFVGFLGGESMPFPWIACKIAT